MSHRHVSFRGGNKSTPHDLMGLENTVHLCTSRFHTSSIGIQYDDLDLSF